MTIFFIMHNKILAKVNFRLQPNFKYFQPCKSLKNKQFAIIRPDCKIFARIWHFVPWKHQIIILNEGSELFGQQIVKLHF